MFRLMNLAFVVVLLSLPPAAAAVEEGASAFPEGSVLKAIPVQSVADVAVDWQRGLAFIAEGGDRTPLVITLAGDTIKRFHGLAGTTHVSMSDDGSAVWMAVPSSQLVTRIDLETMARDLTVTFDPDLCINLVQESQGKLILGSDCLGDPSVLTHNLGSGVTTVLLEGAVAFDMAISPVTPGILAVAGSHLLLVDTTLETPEIVDSVESVDETHVAFDPDGLSLLSGSKWSDAATRRSVDDLSVLAELQLDERPVNFAVSPSGHLAHSGGGDHVNVLIGADPTVVKRRQANNLLLPDSLSWSGDERFLFGVRIGHNDRRQWVALPALGWRQCNGLDPSYVGTDGPDTIKWRGVVDARAGDDVVVVTRGSTVCGGAGNDTIEGSTGDDWLHGGPGDDVLVGRVGTDMLIGGTGSDTLAFLRQRNARVDLGNGSAWIEAEMDTIVNFENVIGTEGHDSLFGTPGANVLVGGKGRDVIDGRGGPDSLHGDGGNDVLLGGPGADTIDGGGGRDLLAGEGGDDALVGGLGVDTVSFASSRAGIDASLVEGTAVGQGTDTLDQVEWLIGSLHADTLIGNGSANYLEGRGSGDELVGNAGGDFLVGGFGIDSAVGGPDSDTCISSEVVESCEPFYDILPDSTALMFNPDAVAMRAALLFGRLLS